MNVNGGRFHLLLGPGDWGRCLGDPDGAPRPLTTLWSSPEDASAAPPPAWDAARAELTLPPRLEILPATEGEAPLDLAARRGAAADAHGNVYWIADSRAQLLVRSAGSGETSAFWPDTHAEAEDALFAPHRPAPTTAQTFMGMVVTRDAWLIVAFEAADRRGFLVFDLVSGGPPTERLWTAGSGPAVHDMAPRPDGGVWLLDRTDRRLWALDRGFSVTGIGADGPEEPELFQPLEGAPRTLRAATRPTGRDLTLAAADIDPIALEPLDDGGLLVLDRTATGGTRIFRLPADGGDATALLELDDPTQDLVVAKGAVRGGERETRLFLAGGVGNQARAWRLAEDGTLIGTAELFPLRRFGGRALIAVQGAAHYDSGLSSPRWTPLVEKPRVRYAETAEFLTPVMDGETPQCVWDRLRLDAVIPSGTLVEVWARASDNPADADGLLGAPWVAQPRPCLACDGGDLPWRGPLALPPGDPKTGAGTWHLLFQEARGRYLQLRLKLSGDGAASPRLRALRAWYPRFSYVERFLPAVYREEPGDFLERFLANMEGVNTAIEDRIAKAQALFDPRTAPTEALAWMADWFDVALDPAWDERRRRLFVARAVDFFRWRGTRHGLELALALAFEPCIDEHRFDDPDPDCVCPRPIRIVERYLSRRIGALAAGDPGSAEGLKRVAPGARWTPAEGNVGLAERWARWLDREPTADELYQAFPLFTPDAALHDGESADRDGFWLAELGFLPRSGAEERTRWRCFQTTRLLTDPDALLDLPRGGPPAGLEAAWSEFLALASLDRRRWQDFLAGRYRRIGRLNAAHGGDWTDFDQVSLPDHLPQGETAMIDWFQFESRLLPIARSAHRFSVLLPMTTSGEAAFDTERRLVLARRIVALEKPAHTVFDVRFYWAMNRLGEARLGLDTQIGQGSRAPELIPPAVLGAAYLGASFIGADGPTVGGDRRRLAC
ncbi:phage tail protein [Caulobacter sp. AP07]|uniref:phage tail protein n=1 Tax=Caulobacter sp. AP07 TaxID=1144304 RepID=UPI0002720C2E|nr:phage tail protein [Caulobacter sp. AP07]EJL30111.1 phage tail protein [Caulobacter sp. AP07]